MIINPKVTAQLVIRKLIGASQNRHPRLMVEITSGNWFNNVSIYEELSDEIKVGLTELIENDEPIPIDELLGEYVSKEKKIKIYTRSIERFSTSFNVKKEYVESIVRLHEYVHAIFHLGCETENPITNPADFFEKRSAIFNTLSASFHEWIAQALCYSVLCKMNMNAEKEAFKKMMNHQPSIYQIDTDLLEWSINNMTNTDNRWSYFWSCVLDSIRTGNLTEQDLRTP